MENTPLLKKHETGVALSLVFLSGFAALVYQVLWMKQLGLLFGNTSQAASATLTSFFAGLAVGSWLLGKRVSKSTQPMRTYAWLEVGIAITALIYFVILLLYRSIYPAIYQSIDSTALLLIIKFALSLLLVFPPAFFMGGTIPVIGQYVVRESQSFGSLSALMYGVNTLGAAIGAALAGFFLPLWLGFNLTCILAISTTSLVAIIAFLLARKAKPHSFSSTPSSTPETPALKIKHQSAPALSRQERRRLEREQKRNTTTSQKIATAPETPAPAKSSKVILALCFLSGFGVLALEVIWTRIFTQVLENSVYTFSAILLVLLICLAIGSLASSLVARLKTPPFITLTVLMLLSAVSIAATPYFFMKLTNGMQLVASTGTWSTYILLIITTAALTVAPSAIILGMVFPYLMKAEEKHLIAPGLSLGRLATANTIGAIIGAMLCGFIFLDTLGMWKSMQLIAWIYIVAALVIPLSLNKRGVVTKLACFATLIGVLIASPKNLPVTSTDPNGAKETVLEVWEGSDCTVSVTESNHLGIAIKINSHYSLGSTSTYMQEKLQADLPLFIKPDAEDLFFLGVGTGTTAGSALDPRHEHVKKVVACELVPEVITAAKKYMTDVNGFDTTGGLFDDPRAKVVVEDGRHYLMATDETFDIINADLFVPFRSGAGSLYTKDHFESCKARLKPGGIFVQWLPMYQLTEKEFSIICKTMIESFPQVSMWRHNFQPGYEVVALIGHENGTPIPTADSNSLEDRVFSITDKDHRDLQGLNLPLNPETITLFYCGNVTESRNLFDDYPINTDNRPIIEYTAPKTYRSQSIDNMLWFVGEPFVNLVDEMIQLCPPDKDPLLINRTATNQRFPTAGQAFHRARVEEVNQDTEATIAAWEKFVREWTKP